MKSVTFQSIVDRPKPCLGGDCLNLLMPLDSPFLSIYNRRCADCQWQRCINLISQQHEYKLHLLTTGRHLK